MEKERIHFKPLHDGMGFHPFSDGLPYAPETKKKAWDSGAGAVSAGRPGFAQPIRTARQIHGQVSTSRPIPLPEKKPEVAVQPQIGILRRRAFAYLLDCILHAGFWLTTNLTALFLFRFQLDQTLILQNLGSFLMFFIFSQWLFITLQEVLFETTAGKLFFQLEFESGHRSLLLRSLVFLFGILFLFGAFRQPQDRLGRIVLKQGTLIP